MKLYPFSALLARMKYITRWSLMHSTRPESLSEHTCDTALLAHILCLIARRYTGTPCRPKTVAVAALYPRCTRDHHRRYAHAGQVQQPRPAGRLQGAGDRERGFHDPSAAAGAGRGGQPLHHRQPADRRGKAAPESC